MVVKRKHDDVEPGQDGAEAAAGGSVGARQMQGQGDKKHSIDSDDEDDDRQAEERFEKMRDDDIEGQEEDTVTLDGDIKITPFNLKEERQEGEFSKDGNFVWNKKEEIKDAWLDNLDWVKIKERSAAEKEREEEAGDAEDEAAASYSELGNYSKMVELMQPGESVARALKRLAGKKGPVLQSQRWKKKKTGGGVTDPAEAGNKTAMLALTGLADEILSRSGNMEIYEETYEGIQHKLAAAKPVKPDIPAGVEDDDALDMFADSLDKEREKPALDSKVAPPVLDEVQWEFKWKAEDEEVHGPHGSQAMLDWQLEGYFSAGCLVRKVGAEQFLDSKRIDFEIYT